MCNVFLLTESRSPLAGRQAGDEKLWLFETLAHNLPRESGRESDFFYLHRPQTIEKARFGKINASKFTNAY
jgi:hypothetical protein